MHRYEKAVMEEMFGQIESLDALRTQLEAQLADATAAGDAARSELAETQAALAVLTEAKVGALVQLWTCTAVD